MPNEYDKDNQKLLKTCFLLDFIIDKVFLGVTVLK